MDAQRNVNGGRVRARASRRLRLSSDRGRAAARRWPVRAAEHLRPWADLLGTISAVVGPLTRWVGWLVLIWLLVHDGGLDAVLEWIATR